jgi:uncharacterized protein YybS (DUF2232 family)
MNNVNQLTKGAMFLTIYSVLLLITLYIPILGIVVNWFLPLPFIFYSAKNSMKSSLVFLVASILISLILGSMLAIPLTLAYGMTGVVIGYLINKQKSRWTIMLAGAIVFLLNTIAQYVVSIVFFNMNFIKELLQTFRESYQTSFEMMKKIGQSPNELVIKQMEASFSMFETLIPSIFVVASFMVVFIILLISIPILKRFGVSLSDWKPFSELTLPKSLLWYYLISMIASMAINPTEGSYWHLALTNLVFILQFCMIIQGISFIFYFFKLKGFPKGLAVTVAIFSLILPFLLSIVRILGIIDLGFNLRQRLEKKTE